ncbi:sulfurtransferase TusA family protein [Orenia marismortui]|uniref:sulfurtransferase TusA family protein n=1 Tax=Orenia marismortui TaxID=46469 RepID=UPI000363F9F1|nr:sulfurtransferase TusA family protein [Orenia marismortui]
MSIQVDEVVDAKGLACPMPIVKTKKAMDQIKPGEVLEVEATDKGSLADIQAWAKSTGHNYIGSQEEGEVLKHYIRKANAEEIKDEVKYPYSISQEELKDKLNTEGVVILDTREPAEYAFGHIPGAVSIPLGEIEDKLDELNKDDEIYVICRTENRSNMAANILSENGFKNVKTVTKGMACWEGATEKNS